MNRFLFFSLLFMVCLGCEQPLELTLESNPSKLVVISNFTAESDLLVRVTNSQSVIGRTEPLIISNAEVEVFENDQFIQRLIWVELPQDAYYTTRDFQPKPGQVYTIRVSAPGFAEVEGRSKIPDRVAIRHFSVTDYKTGESEKGGLAPLSYLLSLQFEDPEGEKNYYHLSLYQEFEAFSVTRSDTIIEKIDRRPIVFGMENSNNLQVVHYNGSILFEDQLFDGFIQSLSVPVNLRYDAEKERPGKLLVELRSVSEEYYLFHTSLSRQQQTPDQPYVDPVILFNNIKNGHGVFAGYATSTTAIKLE